jgi:hypothetical protein
MRVAMMINVRGIWGEEGNEMDGRGQKRMGLAPEGECAKNGWKEFGKLKMEERILVGQFCHF